jgi:hypothetical protein
VIAYAALLEAALDSQELAIYRDHAQARAARHLVLVEGGAYS